MRRRLSAAIAALALLAVFPATPVHAASIPLTGGMSMTTRYQPLGCVRVISDFGDFSGPGIEFRLSVLRGATEVRVLFEGDSVSHDLVACGLATGDYSARAWARLTYDDGGTDEGTMDVGPIRVNADTTAPSIVGRSPGSGTTGVDRDRNIGVRFSEGIKGWSGRVLLRDMVTGALVPAAVTYDATAHRVALNPTVRLARYRTYKVIVRSGITDDAGNGFGGATWRFRTGGS